MKRFLEPEPNLPQRLTILGVLMVPVLIVAWFSLLKLILASVMPLLLTGTYRVSRISGERFLTDFHVAFIPMGRERCKLPAVIFIHTTYQANQTGCLTFLMFGPLQWIFSIIFDTLIPSLGGPYEIWLETAKGREILAWKGYNQQQYEKNLELLRNHTGAEVRIR